MYNDTVLDHFTNPRNVGILQDADGIGRTGNPADGDSITIYIKVYNDKIHDVRFKTFGCGAAVAASSMLTVLAVGKTLDDAMKITNDDVAGALGGLPPQKLLCSNFAADALHEAINDYQKNMQHHHDSEKFTESISEHPSFISEGLTDKNEIQRYLRHIIIPQISGAGQKKLIETSVFLCAQSINACDVMLNYMAASGISHIYCLLESKDNYESVLTHVRDLNPDVNIEIIDNVNIFNNQISNIEYGVSFNILTGDSDFVSRIIKLLFRSVSRELTPTFVSIAYSWKGYVGLLSDAKSISDFSFKLSNVQSSDEKTSSLEYFDQLGMSMSYAFMNTLVVTELIKAHLNIGSILNDLIYFDLLEMEFSKDMPESYFKPLNLQNYDMKNKLSQIKVLIIGTGGLGCPAALALSKAGVGTIGLVDFDSVDLSNLNRQILHTTSRLGMKKVESAKEALKAINQNINIESYATAFSDENAMDMINNYDIIIDGLDNLPTRYLLNDACFFAKKPIIEAGALSFYGQITTIVPEDGPCYRCLVPESSESLPAPSCSEAGILGPVTGLIGTLEAVEAIKMIIGTGSNLKGRLLLYDALETDLSLIEFNKNISCALCGDNPSIQKLSKYTFVCKDKDF